jgi:hypothetical protein
VSPNLCSEPPADKANQEAKGKQHTCQMEEIIQMNRALFEKMDLLASIVTQIASKFSTSQFPHVEMMLRQQIELNKALELRNRELVTGMQILTNKLLKPSRVQQDDLVRFGKFLSE